MTAIAARSTILGRLTVTALVTLALLIGGALIAPDEAHAWYYATAGQRPGAVSVPQVWAVDDGQYTTYGPYLTIRSNGGPVVYRSPATSGAQDVMGQYTIQYWNGSRWVNLTSQWTPAYRIPAGYRWVRLPALHRSPTTQRGHFRVVWSFAWVNANTGAALGRTAILPNTTADFRCYTTARPCQYSAHWIRTGRVYALGGGW
jgi:hypothetical protein